MYRKALFVLRVFRLKYINYDISYCMSLNIVFIIAISADPDEMPHYVAFHQGLRCLSKCLYMESRMKRVIKLIPPMKLRDGN